MWMISARATLALLGGAALVNPASLSAQAVQKSALDALLPDVSLKPAKTLSTMPLKGAGQKIKVQLQPAALKVNGVTAAGVTVPVDVTVELSGWAVKRGTTPLSEGSDYKTMATDPATGARTFVFKTKTYHWTTDPAPAGDALTVSATVKLKAGSPIVTESAPKPLSLPITVPRLGIPKLLALYRNTSYQEWKDGVHEDPNEGFMLIMVPSNSPLPEGPLKMLPFETLTGFLGDLKTAAENLAQLAVGAGDFNFVGSSWVLGLFLGEVTPYNTARRRIRIGGHDDFGEIEMLDRTFNDVEANDEISSLIFLADKGNRAYLFNDINYDTNDEGWFTLEAGEGEAMVVRVPSLVGRSPNSQPAGRLDVKRSDETFNNKLSSVRFSEP